MKTILTLTLSIIGLSIMAQTNVTEKFLYKFHPNNEVPLPYRLFVPENIDTDKSYPLILTLHGRGESGTDNEIQIEKNHIATVWADSSFQLNHPSYIVSPQCPWENYWNDEHALNSVFEILDSLISVFNIDLNRIYITGLSMGGYGTWAALAARPNMFAAALPVCGAGIVDDVKLFKHVPVWNHHGGNDNVVPVQASRDLMKEYEELGTPLVTTNCYNYICKETSKDEKEQFIMDNVDYLYSEYKGVGHDSWNRAYTDSLVLEWMLSKTKRHSELISIEDNGEYELLPDQYILQLNSALDSGYHELLFSNDLGYTWTTISSDSLAIDSLTINTELLPESAFGMFKIQQVSNTLINCADYTSYKKIDNEENGSPLLRLGLNKKLSTVNDNELAINFLVGDAEDASLTLSVYFKQDPDSTYQFVTSFEMETMPFYQEKLIEMNNLPYGTKARLKFELSDGELVAIDSTHTFKNNHNKPVSIANAINNYFRLSPNPSNGVFNVELNTDNSINTLLEIYNTSGQLVYSEPFNSNKKQIDLTKFNKGVYLVQVKNHIKIFNKKVVVK